LFLAKTSISLRVSSGTSKDGRNVLDGSQETCWTSDNLPPNSDTANSLYTLSFKLAEPITTNTLHSLSLTFAGGFSPISLKVLASAEDGKTWSPVSVSIFPKDSNAKQHFLISPLVQQTASWLRLELTGSTDDYGRVTIYQAEIFIVQ
jgi:hypothetical protein